MRVTECTAEEAAPHLQAVFCAKANPHGLTDLTALLHGCRCFLVQGDSRTLAAYALRGQGGQVWIQAAAGCAEFDLCVLFADLIAQHGKGFQSIGFRTYRRGLVKKAQALGYRVMDDSDGYTMTKDI